MVIGISRSTLGFTQFPVFALADFLKNIDESVDLQLELWISYVDLL